MSGRKYDYVYPLNKKIDEFYELQSFARIVVGAVVGVGAVIGALAGLGLSFVTFGYRWSYWCCISGFANTYGYRSTLLPSQ